MRATMLIVMLLTAPLALAEAGPRYFIVNYAPGHKWRKSLSFDQQPGIKAHRRYVRRLNDDHMVVMAGPLVDARGAMLLLRTDSLGEAEKLVARDPAVLAHILAARVTGWRVEISSMPNYRRVVPQVQLPDKPFRIDRIGPEPPSELAVTPNK